MAEDKHEAVLAQKMENLTTDNKTKSGPRKLLVSHHIDIGTKRTQEDTFTILENLTKAKEWTFFGIFDGHGGGIASDFCRDNMHNVLDSFLCAHKENEDMKQTMLNAYAQGDKEFAKAKTPVMVNGTEVSDYIGCTACTVLINTHTDDLIVANLGDTRTTLCRAGKAIQLSIDHSADDPEETKRIEKSGHTLKSGRIDGIINVSRAIGDLAFKQKPNLSIAEQAISCVPEVNVTKLHKDDEYIVIATDGLWTILDNDETVNWVNEKLQAGADRKTIAKDLVNYALEVDGYDNITVIVVFLK